MGAINESNAIYLNISNGKISRRILQPTKTSITRITKEGKTVHEEMYKGWEGFIEAITVREHKEFGKFWNITLKDETGEEAIVTMNYSGGYASAFLKTLPNVDLSKKVQLIPKLTVEGDKKKSTLFVLQEGIPLKRFYNLEEKNGLPELQKIKIKGKLTYDDSDMMAFLENMINEKILPKLKKTVNNNPVLETVNEEEDADENKMPF